MMLFLSVNQRLALTLLCISNFALSINVVFDLGAVLIETKSSAALQELGFARLARYCIAHPTNLVAISTHLRTRLFTFLHQTLERSPDEALAYDEHGNLIPQIMCDWLKGTKSPAAVRAYLNEWIKQHPEYFASNAEKNLIRRMATLIFTPHLFIKTTALIPEMADIAKECHQRSDKLYILSNWDAESFNALIQRYPDFFKLFDGAVLSGTCHALKPAKAPYEHLLTTHNLNPQETVFIDDRPENIATAQQLGINGIEYKRTKAYWFSLQKTTNCAQVRKKLKLQVVPSDSQVTHSLSA
jgi:HAD superfamily hydrolase (TIGR01509 family)